MEIPGGKHLAQEIPRDQQLVQDAKILATPQARECRFCEKTRRTQTANGGAHRMSENVTFERREFRATPPLSLRHFGLPFLALLGQDGGSLDTNSIK